MLTYIYVYQFAIHIEDVKKWLKKKTFKFKAGSRIAATSKVELFVIIVYGWKPLTIIIKSSTLDVAAVLDPPLNILQIRTRPSNK